MRVEPADGVETPDTDLIARWRAGDERAATSLVERHAPGIARYVASLGMPDGVDEVVQDTLVRAFGSIDTFRGDSAFRTWLFTIARRLVLDSRRASRRRAEMVEVSDAHGATEYDALDGLVAEESEGKMREALSRLTKMQREVFTLRVNEGLSYRDIAEVAGTTEGAARVHYHNALRCIKESLYV